MADVVRPTLAYVARKHSAGMKGRSKPARHSYSLVPAVLDLTSGVFPTGLTQNPTIDIPDKNFHPRTVIDEQIHALCEHRPFGQTISGTDIPDDNPEEWKDAPIGLQLIGQRLEEEKIVGMLGIIRDALEAAQMPPAV